MCWGVGVWGVLWPCRRAFAEAVHLASISGRAALGAHTAHLAAGLVRALGGFQCHQPPACIQNQTRPCNQDPKGAQYRTADDQELRGCKAFSYLRNIFTLHLFYLSLSCAFFLQHLCVLCLQMTLKRVHGPHTLLRFYQCMLYRPICMEHVVLKAEATRHMSLQEKLGCFCGTGRSYRQGSGTSSAEPHEESPWAPLGSHGPLVLGALEFLRPFR